MRTITVRPFDSGSALKQQTMYSEGVATEADEGRVEAVLTDGDIPCSDYQILLNRQPFPARGRSWELGGLSGEGTGAIGSLDLRHSNVLQLWPRSVNGLTRLSVDEIAFAQARVR